MGETARERALRALAAHAPDLAGTGLRELGHGLDNAAFHAGDLVVRVAERGDGHGVRAEARLLALVAAHVDLPVPVVRFSDEEAGVLAYPMLPGRPLLGRPAPPGLGRTIGRFLRRLHAIDPAAAGGIVPVEDAEPAEWLEDLDGPAHLLRVVRGSVPAPGRGRVLAHADLGAEHLLERDGAVTGVIDWSDAAVTDPALDFARLYRDFGPDVLAEALDAYGGLPGGTGRIVFYARCAALEDLAYGGAHGEAAARSLSWLFP
ncbi:phosphotransferase [Dactylosporangium aurantiacum]|uniref:Phosphotransferase n=1 Tax=Dactylosporangium aurantiacum TaxID=35754 RepID=A0A9Q9ICD5_9ACTN|nr:phosphotransferase [Dactylosporangium aurantiacum]MDG6107026.1 phosphotransferase [Dactylosporangium aurantiacum]UWZ50623.1 phosphotransferase [Dactylosporangium aurantiacum]